MTQLAVNGQQFEPINQQLIEDMKTHLNEWKTIQPSVERLVALEGELKELITQLSQMAQEQTYTQKDLLDEQHEITVEKEPVPELVEISSEKEYMKQPEVKPETVVETSYQFKNSTAVGVQLYSLTDKNALIANWNELLNKHSKLLVSYTPIYEEIKVRGETYYRVKVGPFNSLQQANQLCAKLQAVNTPCFTVRYNGVPFL
ncbi:hypothetical protein GARC_3126 [Paraglaciecola arctica BSs20135]|uniref:SPOR domain-containing protein n=2 Tax=Paraglaciecola TaxID=1621534 RepID=K6Z9F7_9ALTE|nr:hypothetical protein GARC_3126 [Paraglaciecola arctica BSs20135]